MSETCFPKNELPPDDKKMEINPKELVMYSSILMGAAIILIAVVVHDSASLNQRYNLIQAYTNLSQECYTLQTQCSRQCGYTRPVIRVNYSDLEKNLN